MVSCCGVQLPPLEPEMDEKKCSTNFINVEKIKDELFVSIEHEMSKTHYISFLAMLTCDSVDIVKLYPEQNAEVWFKMKGRGKILAYCNRHGFFCNAIN